MSENVIKISGSEFPVKIVSHTPRPKKGVAQPAITYAALTVSDVGGFAQVWIALGEQLAKTKDGLQNFLDNMLDSNYREAMAAAYKEDILDPETNTTGPGIVDELWVASLLEAAEAKTKKSDLEAQKDTLQTDLNIISRWDLLHRGKPTAEAELLRLGFKDEEVLKARAAYLLDEIDKINAKLQELAVKAEASAAKRKATQEAKKAAEAAAKAAAPAAPAPAK
jgi:hypothetical protein